MENFDNLSGGADASSNGSDNFEDDEDPEPVKAAKRATVEPEEYKFAERDVILYNLGIGATAKELKWTYENADGFCVSLSEPSAASADLSEQALPTFGVIPSFGASTSMSMDFVPNFNPVGILNVGNAS